MTKLNIRQLKARGAALAGEHREGTRGLVLLYCGVIAALTLGSSGLNLFLNARIGDTGGLGGLGMRSVLQTVQRILSYLNLFFGPFWSAGFLYAMLAMVRGRVPQTRDLGAGFRRFGRILGHMAFEFLLVLTLLMSAVNLASVLFAFAPGAAELAEQLAPVLADPNLIAADGTVNLALFPAEALRAVLIPMLVLTLALFVPVYVFLSYGFRMSMYLVMERPIGAVRARFESMRLMRGRKWQLLKMDLSFWWYYLLGAVISVVGYLDVILGRMGIPVPVDPVVMFFATLAAYCVLYTLLCLWKKREVDAAYVLAFEEIAYPEQTEALSETE